MSLWKTGFDRSKNNDIRKGDNDFVKWLKTSGVEEIDLNLPSGNIWLSLNYGATSDSVSGQFLTQDQLTELKSYLTDGYQLPEKSDFVEISFYCNDIDYKNKQVLLSRNDKTLIIPNVGYITDGYEKPNVTKNMFYYVGNSTDHTKYLGFKFYCKNRLELGDSMCLPSDCQDMLQVRFIKKTKR